MGGAWRHDLIPVLSLTGVVLDALGGQYLAYDLLGGKNGPLRMVTKSVSYGVMLCAVGFLAAIRNAVQFSQMKPDEGGRAWAKTVGRRLRRTKPITALSAGA